MYESTLIGSEQPCVVSGYPVTGKQPVVFHRTNRQANADVWSKLAVAAKMAPHKNVTDIIEFIEKWCGSANYDLATY